MLLFQVSQIARGKHFCEVSTRYVINGAAIDYCYEDDRGKLIVENGEYDSEVNYCPMCGYKAKVEAEKY